MRYNNKEFRALYSLVNHLAEVGPTHYNHNIVAAICCWQRDKARATTAEHRSRVKDGQPMSKAEAAVREALAARPKPQRDWFVEATELARESAAEQFRRMGVVPRWAEEQEAF